MGGPHQPQPLLYLSREGAWQPSLALYGWRLEGGYLRASYHRVLEPVGPGAELLEMGVTEEPGAPARFDVRPHGLRAQAAAALEPGPLVWGPISLQVIS